MQNLHITLLVHLFLESILNVTRHDRLVFIE